MVRIMKKDGNRLEGIGERIDVRLTLIEEALGMTPGDPEIYGNWIASKAPEPEVGEEEVGVIVALALGCYVGLNSTGVVAVSVVFTLLFTLYAVTVHALCLEYRKSGLGN